MPLRDIFKVIGIAAAVILVLLGMSYWSELPKYRFEKSVTVTAQKLRGARLVSSKRTGELTSPVSWFWPAATAWTYATPDPFVAGRFYTVSLFYEEDKTVKYLVDVDCVRRMQTRYDLDEPDTALPAMDLLGNPVVAPNGKTYRKADVNEAPDAQQMHAYCDTDWSAEKHALADRIRQAK